jgi:hypothetical protein
MDPITEDGGVSLKVGWSRAVGEPEPPWLRRNVGALLFFGPLTAGGLLTLFGGWQYAAGLEAGGMLALAVGSVATIIAMLRGRTLPVQHFRFSIDLNRRHRLWVPVFLAAGIGCGYVAATVGADWFAPVDRIPVVITSVSHSLRGGTDTVQSDHGRFTTPWLVGVDPAPRRGPATLVVGHFSHALLRIEQAAP